MVTIKVFQYPKYIKTNLYDLKMDISKHIDIDYKYLIDEPNNKIYMSEDIYKLQDSVKNYSKLNDIAKTIRGIEGYKYKYSDSKLNSNWLFFFTGQVYRYTIVSDKGKKWVEFTGNEKSDYLDFFIGSRILMRRIISRRNRLQSTIIEEDFIMGKDLYSIKINDSLFDNNIY